MRHRARNGWLGAVGGSGGRLALMQSASVPSAGSNSQPQAVSRPRASRRRRSGPGRRTRRPAARAQGAARLGGHEKRPGAARLHVARAGDRRAARLRLGPLGHVHPHRLAHHLQSGAEDRRDAGERRPEPEQRRRHLLPRPSRRADHRPQKAELLAFVRGGKGFVAAHTGLTAFESWPEFGEMLGAIRRTSLHGTGPRDERAAGSSHRQALGCRVRLQRRVLSRGRTFAREGGRAAPLRPGERAVLKTARRRRLPALWTKMYGQGRVVYSSLSHSTEAWDIRNLQIMMFEAIRWSLGLSDAPVEPHAVREPVAAR